MSTLSAWERLQACVAPAWLAAAPAGSLASVQSRPDRWLVKLPDGEVRALGRQEFEAIRDERLEKLPTRDRRREGIRR